jgi:hypothetical protein
LALNISNIVEAIVETIVEAIVEAITSIGIFSVAAFVCVTNGTGDDDVCWHFFECCQTPFFE